MINKKRALEPIQFMQLLHLTDDFYGQQLKLLDWQYDVIWNVYGTVTDEVYRQYRYAYLEIPKKNGKTTMIAGLGLYHLLCDPPDGQIYCCAAEKGQAGLVYKAAVSMIEQDEMLKSMLKVTDSKKEITNRVTKTTLKVLSAEAYSKHGLNPTVVIFDELHAQPNRDLWDIMTFGAGAARKEPLWWVITTAGDDPDRHSIGWEVHEYARKVRDGELVDPTWYVKIFGAADDANIWDEAVWHEVNPSLGHTIPVETVRQEALQARNSDAAEKLFRWLRLNQWVSTKKIGWLPITLWDTTTDEWNKDMLLGRECVAGLDLSRTTDLSAVALLFPPTADDRKWRFSVEGFIPEDRMREKMREDGVPYDQWVNAGWLHATPGDVIDYEYVEARLVALSKLYKLSVLGKDQWQASMLTQRIEKSEEIGQIITVPQDMKNLSPAMKELERLMRTGEMVHQRNSLGRWCFGNVVIATDGNENIKPMKNRSKDRIDPVVALIIAMATAQIVGIKGPSVYEARGIRVV